MVKFSVYLNRCVFIMNFQTTYALVHINVCIGIRRHHSGKTFKHKSDECDNFA